jgi:precorrin-4 methylase
MTEFADLGPRMIPGISSFNAATAALGRSITSGGSSRSVILTAAMGSRGKYKGSDSLEKLAESRSTMVFFTMGSKLSEVVEKLKIHYPGDTPMAIVFHAGYRETENSVTATLDTILDKVDGDDLPFEHLIYVGDFLR